jgi:hypothetical protein
MTFSAQPSFEPIASPDSENSQAETVSAEPQWLLEGKLCDSWGEHVSLPEWEEETDQKGYRAKNGWKVSLIFRGGKVAMSYLLTCSSRPRPSFNF